jgi:hypothetical protein
MGNFCDDTKDSSDFLGLKDQVEDGTLEVPILDEGESDEEFFKKQKYIIRCKLPKSFYILNEKSI